MIGDSQDDDVGRWSRLIVFTLVLLLLVLAVLWWSGLVYLKSAPPPPTAEKTEVSRADLATELPILSRVPAIAERLVFADGKGLLKVRVIDPMGILDTGYRLEILGGKFAYATRHQRVGDELQVKLKGESLQPDGVLLSKSPHFEPHELSRAPATRQPDGSYFALLDLSEVQGAVVEFTVVAPEEIRPMLTASAYEWRPSPDLVPSGLGSEIELHGKPEKALRAFVTVPSMMQLDLTVGDLRYYGNDWARMHRSHHAITEMVKQSIEVTVPSGGLTVQLPADLPDGAKRDHVVALIPEHGIALSWAEMKSPLEADGKARFHFLAPGRYLIREDIWWPHEEFPFPSQVVQIGSGQQTVTLGAATEQSSLRVSFDAGAPTELRIVRANFMYGDGLTKSVGAEVSELRIPALDRDLWYVRAKRDERIAYALVDTRGTETAEAFLDNWTYPALLSLTLHASPTPGDIAVTITDASGAIHFEPRLGRNDRAIELSAVPGPLRIRAQEETGLVAETELMIPERVGGRQPFEATLEFRKP